MLQAGAGLVRASRVQRVPRTSSAPMHRAALAVESSRRAAISVRMDQNGGRGITGDKANEPAQVRSPVGPFELELDLLFVPLSFVLDVELGASGHVDPLS
jgi:hypothetical protein